MLLVLVVLLVLLVLVLELAIPPIPAMPPIPPAPPTSLPLLDDDELDELLLELVMPGFSSTSPQAANAMLENVAPRNIKVTLFIALSSLDAWTNQAVKPDARKASVATRAYHRVLGAHLSALHVVLGSYVHPLVMTSVLPYAVLR